MGARFAGLIIDSLILAVPIGIVAAFLGAFHERTSCNLATGNCAREFDVTSTLALDGVWLLIGIMYSALLIGLTGRRWATGSPASGSSMLRPGASSVVEQPGCAGSSW
jgi:hypothetical protein